jgi:transcriptional regulator with XRE-family HTH domain
MVYTLRVTESSDPIRLAHEISSARIAVRRSLRDVADEAEISAAYLQKLERGQVGEPSPRILKRIATTLNIKYGRLMECAGYEFPRDKQTSTPSNPVFAATSLTETEERAVAAFIEHLVTQRPDK